MQVSPVYLDDFDAASHSGDGPPDVASPWSPPEQQELSAVFANGRQTYLTTEVGMGVDAERQVVYPSPRTATNVGLSPYSVGGMVLMGNEQDRVPWLQADTPTTKPMFFPIETRGPFVELTPNFVVPPVLAEGIGNAPPQLLGATEPSEPVPFVSTTKSSMLFLGALVALGVGAYLLAN